MTAQARVDVLIPVYNAAPYVRSAIESIQAQSVRDIRICVVDDGSTDGSADILAELAAGDPRIVVLTQANRGIVDALNAGLALGRAEFVARHDADDLAYPTRLEAQLRFLADHPEVLAVGGRARHIDAEGARLGTLAKFQPASRCDPAHIPAREPYLLHPFLMVRRAALEQVGGYRHVIHAEDTDLYWRLQAMGELHNQPDLQGEYRMHPQSISSQSIRSGRVMAVSSQLCALSAMRRAAGVEDLEFTHEIGVRLKAAAASLEDACRAVDGPLTADEARHLRFAAGVKLLGLADYRPYEVEGADCIFLSRSLAASQATVTGLNRKLILQAYAGTAARLAAMGRWRDARTLLTPAIVIPFLLRFLVRKVLPVKLYRFARRVSREASSQLKELMRREPPSTSTAKLLP